MLDLHHFRALRATIAATLPLLVGLAHGAESAATPWPTAGWEASTGEAQGVSSAALADLVDFGAASEMDSLLVVRHGRIVVDTYYAPFRAGQPHLVNSVTKAVVGTLVGIAVKEGRIQRLDQPVVDLFFERDIANASAEKKAMTLETLLDSTSGLDWTEPLSDAPPETMLQMARSRDWVGFVLDRPMAQPPGRAFNYDSGTWHLLSAVLTKKTGMDTLAYAKQALFAPLGIGDTVWRQDPQGIRAGGFGLFLQPRDMAKIGYLYLHHGAWAGEQLLPPAWSEHVFHATVDMGLGASPALRYANGWWTIPDRHAYMAVGFLRQLIIVLPEIDVVAVVTGRRHYPFLSLIDRIVAAARSAAPLPADDEGAARLAAHVREAAVEKATPVPAAPPLAATLSGRTWQFAPNPAGLRSLKLELTAAEPRYDIVAEGLGGAPRRISGPIGLDGLFRSQAIGAGGPLAVKGRWLNDGELEITSRTVGEGLVTTYRLAFHGNEVDVSFTSNQGFTARLHGTASD
jgi:CubicO group peptidase (beta-lactamase class C family)